MQSFSTCQFFCLLLYSSWCLHDFLFCSFKIWNEPLYLCKQSHITTILSGNWLLEIFLMVRCSSYRWHWCQWVTCGKWGEPTNKNHLSGQAITSPTWSDFSSPFRVLCKLRSCDWQQDSSASHLAVFGDEVRLPFSLFTVYVYVCERARERPAWSVTALWASSWITSHVAPLILCTQVRNGPEICPCERASMTGTKLDARLKP